MLSLYTSMLETDDDKASFEAFYRKYSLLCLHLAQKITNGNTAMAADALHDAFVVIIREWKKFSALPCNIQRARFVIAVKHKAIDLLREAKRKACDELDEDKLNIRDDEMDATVILESEEGYRCLLRCVAKLPLKYRAIFELRYVGDMKNAEIAELLGMTGQLVATRLLRAKRQLQNILRKEGITYAKRR